MNKTYLASVILAALYPISHNNTLYQAGELLELSDTDAKFLRLSKCVREPTVDELKSYQELQNPAPIITANEDDTDHAGLEDKPSSDNEDAADVNAEGWDDKVDDAPVVEVEAPQPETVEPEPVVEAPPQTELEVVEPETLQPEPEAVANPYDGWLKKDLNAELDKRGIDHDATATNDTLEALLIEDDAVQATAAS